MSVPLIVHAGGPGIMCRTAILLDEGSATGPSRFRILRPSIGAIGSQDEEGDLPHWDHARTVPDPLTGTRTLLSWHGPNVCRLVRYVLVEP